MNEALYICFAEEADAPFIAEIEKECFSVAWSENAILDEMSAENSIFLVCRNEKKETVGYVSGRNNCGEFYINNTAVSSVWRKNGIGERLMTGIIAEAEAKGCEFLTLEVRASNDAARCLYEKCGLSEVGRRRGFYRNPNEDAVLYTIYFDKSECR